MANRTTLTIESSLLNEESRHRISGTMHLCFDWQTAKEYGGSYVAAKNDWLKKVAKSFDLEIKGEEPGIGLFGPNGALYFFDRFVVVKEITESIE